MLTRLRVRNFKNLESLDIELGQTVVFIGPNNSGKTTALQALALWRSGIVALARSAERTEYIDGVRIATLNRLAITHTPVSDTKLLWNRLDFDTSSARTGTGDPPWIKIEVEGEAENSPWISDLTFNRDNPESITCSTVAPPGSSSATIIDDPDLARLAFLPPMSGLAAEEPEIQTGRIDVLIGEGQTAQIMRNLCFRVHESTPASWSRIASRMRTMFGIDLHVPVRDIARGSIRLRYMEQGIELDIASAGRGLQQTLLLLAHLYANPGTTLLLDEPDAHLEILRQRQIYNVLTECAAETGSQIIAASHSEIILNEAADRDVVIAFVGKPHRINDRGSQVLKALREIGYDQFHQADLKGAVLYLEGATDLAILRALAIKLGHPAAALLEQPFVHYVADQPNAALHHFHGLREARPDLVGFALFDRLGRGLPRSFAIPGHSWRKCEIENYIASRETLLRFADATQQRGAMEKAVDEVERALATLGDNAWSDDIKMSERVLPAIFSNFYRNLGLRNVMAKADFHVLVNHIDPAEIDPEVTGVLDLLCEALRHAKPA